MRGRSMDGLRRAVGLQGGGNTLRDELEVVSLLYCTVRTIFLVFRLALFAFCFQHGGTTSSTDLKYVREI